jgi:large subunit ribosomal protein L16
MQKFLPKRVSKFSKSQRGTLPFAIGGSFKRTTLIYGNFGIEALEAGMIKPKQAEAARIVIRKTIKYYKNIKLYSRIFCNHPITKKGIGSRLGKGKGEIDSRVDKVAPNRILFEINIPTPPSNLVGSRIIKLKPELLEKINIILKAFRKASFKLPIKTKIITSIKMIR